MKTVNTNEMLETVRECDLCHSPRPFITLADEYVGEDTLLGQIGGTGRYETVLCAECGWVFKPRVLTSVQLRRLYSDVGGDATYDPVAAQSNRRRSQKLFQLVRRYINLDQDTLDILDVGGGIGQVSQSFSQEGHRVHLLDVATQVPIHPAMLIHNTTLSEFQSSQRFDVVLMNHVLEHLWSPTSTLLKVGNLMKQGAILYVEVPFELYTPYIKKKLGDPCHVGYFSLAVLEHFLEKTGFSILLLQRTLGRYNATGVMVIQAVARKAAGGAEGALSTDRKGWLKSALEMFHPHQVVLILLRMKSRLFGTRES
jgi:hypothetical protein